MVYTLKSLIKKNNLPRSQRPTSADTLHKSVKVEPSSFSLKSQLKCHEVEKLSTTPCAKMEPSCHLLHLCCMNQNDLLSVSFMTFSEITKELMPSNCGVGEDT